VDRGRGESGAQPEAVGEDEIEALLHQQPGYVVPMRPGGVDLPAQRLVEVHRRPDAQLGAGRPGHHLVGAQLDAERGQRRDDARPGQLDDLVAAGP
jgi:hypothetical protein